MDQNKESLENYIFMLKNISGQVTDPAKKQTIRDKCEEVTNLESQITQMLKEKRLLFATRSFQRYPEQRKERRWAKLIENCIHIRDTFL